MVDLNFQRRQMVDTQLRTDGICDADILSAILNVDKDVYLPSQLAAFAYSDQELRITNKGETRIEVTPNCLAHLIKAGAIKSSDEVLCVAPATGYAPAVISHLAATVTVIDDNSAVLSDMAKNWEQQEIATIFTSETDLDAPQLENKKFDVIVIFGSIAQSPTPYLDLLNEAGRLIVIEQGNHQAGATLKRYSCLNGSVSEQKIRSMACYFAHFLTKKEEFAFAM